MTVFFRIINRKETKRMSVLLSISIFACLFLNFPNVMLAEENLSMYSGSYALMDGDTGRILKGKEETNPMANASTTKILTCIVALEKCELDEVVTISANAASQPKVRLGMKEGECYPLKDLLHGLMLESYNDCAVAIAEHVAGSTNDFADLMNQKAKEIGCKDTYFITPNGLDAEDEAGFHHTTAIDLCRLMAYCTWESPMKDTFLSITQTRNYSGVFNGKSYSFVNRNAFLNQMDGVLSGKTGFTNKAGYCYVAAMEVNGEKYCIALLACGWPNNKTYKWKDARTLFEYGMESYDIETVKVEALETYIDVNGYTNQSRFNDINKTQTLELYAPQKEYQVLIRGDEDIETKVDVYTNIQLPIKEGQEIGECKVYLGETLLDSYKIKTRQYVSAWNWKKIWKDIVYQFFTLS